MAHANAVIFSSFLGADESSSSLGVSVPAPRLAVSNAKVPCAAAMTAIPLEGDVLSAFRIEIADELAEFTAHFRQQIIRLRQEIAVEVWAEFAANIRQEIASVLTTFTVGFRQEVEAKLESVQARLLSATQDLNDTACEEREHVPRKLEDVCAIPVALAATLGVGAIERESFSHQRTVAAKRLACEEAARQQQLGSVMASVEQLHVQMQMLARSKVATASAAAAAAATPEGKMTQHGDFSPAAPCLHRPARKVSDGGRSPTPTTPIRLRPCASPRQRCDVQFPSREPSPVTPRRGTVYSPAPRVISTSMHAVAPPIFGRSCTPPPAHPLRFSAR